MSYRSLLRASRILAIAIVILSLSAAAFAQVQPRPPLSDAELLSQYDPVQLREFRDTFRAVFIANTDVLKMMGRQETARYFEDRALLVDKMSDVQIARLISLDVDLRPLMESTDRLRTIVQRNIQEAAKLAPNSTGLPDADYSFCGSSRNSGEGMLAAQVVLDVAKGVWSAASRACDEVIVAACFGGNTSLICIIVDTVLFIAETVFRGFEFCDNDIDSAEIKGSYDRLGHVHSDLVAAETNIKANDDANRTTIINNDNTNTTTITTNDDENTTNLMNLINASTTAIITNANDNRTLIINNDNANRDMLVAELRAVACEIIRLLNTPEGQRDSALASCDGQPGYPYDFPEKKLTVTSMFPSLTEPVAVAPRNNTDN
jgi:hypothetical protein